MCILHSETFHMAQQLAGKRDSINKATLEVQALDSRLLRCYGRIYTRKERRRIEGSD